MGEHSVAVLEHKMFQGHLVPELYGEYGVNVLDTQNLTARATQKTYLTTLEMRSRTASEYDVIVLDNGLLWGRKGVELFYESQSSDRDVNVTIYTNVIGLESDD